LTNLVPSFGPTTFKTQEVSAVPGLLLVQQASRFPRPSQYPVFAVLMENCLVYATCQCLPGKIEGGVVSTAIPYTLYLFLLS